MLIIPDLKYDGEFFNFTKGRFVCNEQHELAQRHREFDVNELARRAAKAVNAKYCKNIRKCPDGMHNRALLLSMDNGREVVAKIPNPNSGRPHFTTASEVATMKFAREVLGTPLPEVYAWSSRAQDNAVGAEYIIMEKMAGVELEHVWPKMRIQDRLEVVKGIAEYQRVWSSTSFEQFGSLYFSEDVDGASESALRYTNHEGETVYDRRFIIGPSTSRESFDDGRSVIEFDRGPWKSLEDYHTAIGNRELECVRHVEHLPSSPITLYGPGLYQPLREKKVRAIEMYSRLMRFLLPNDRSLGSAHMWHSDLHGGNIFVDPANPTKVIGLIDWQSTEIAPLYFHARQPHLIDYEGSALYGLDRPALSPDLAQLDANAQREAKALFLHQSLCALYRKIVYQQCPRIYNCLAYQGTAAFTLLLLARNLLIDGEAAYMAQAIELEKIWDTLPGTNGEPFPTLFSSEEKQTIIADMEAATTGMEVMRGIRESIGDLFPDQGLVPHDRYDDAIDALSQMRDQVIAEFAKDADEAKAWMIQWPFNRD